MTEGRAGGAVPMERGTTVAVTGATGFIGQRLVRRLLAEGLSVRALVLPAESVPSSWGGEVAVVRGDVTRSADVAAAVEGAAVVFHLAAVVGDWGDEADFRRITVLGTDNVCSAASDSGARVVLASSIVVYGDALARRRCDEDTPWGRALGPYSRSKQQQERSFLGAVARGSLDGVALRFANVYGAGSRPWVDSAVAELRRGSPTLLSGGDGDAGLCHVEHAVDALVAAARADHARGKAYNVADGWGVTWRRYFGDLALVSGAPAPRSLPRAAAVVAAHALEWTWRRLGRRERPAITLEALNLVGSDLSLPIERARRDLGFTPHVTYEEALAEIRSYVSST